MLLHPDVGHDTIDELRAAQLVANGILDSGERKNFLRKIAGCLPLDKLFGNDYDVKSGGGVFERLSDAGFDTIIKWKPIEVGGLASGLSFVYDPDNAVDTIAVTLSGIRVYTNEDQLEELSRSEAEGCHQVLAAHLPVLAIRAWDLAA